MKMMPRSIAEELFIKFCESYKKRDLEAALKLFTKNANMWGSGLDEYRVGLKQIEEQLKRDWSQAEKGEISILSFVPTSLDALWAAAVCKAKITVDGKEHIFDHLRGTVVIEKEDGVWKISHTHASFPDYRNTENGSFPVGEA